MLKLTRGGTKIKVLKRLKNPIYVQMVIMLEKCVSKGSLRKLGKYVRSPLTYNKLFVDGVTDILLTS